MTAILKIDRLCKTYDNGTCALREISFSVEPGEFVVVLGKSGSGKSTLMRCINRLVEPTSGRIFLDGEEVTGATPSRLRALRKKISMIFQQYNLIPRYSVQSNALMGRLAGTSSIASLMNCFSAGDVERSSQVLDRLGLSEKYFDRSENLSGGQQQRVGLARALMQEPELILADEPTANLDSENSHQILELMRELNHEYKAAVIFSTHDEKVTRYIRREVRLEDGRVSSDQRRNGREIET